MSNQFVMQAIELIDAALDSEVTPADVEKLKAIREDILRFLRGRGIFIGTKEGT